MSEFQKCTRVVLFFCTAYIVSTNCVQQLAITDLRLRVVNDEFADGTVEFSAVRSMVNTHSHIGNTLELRLSTYTMNTLGSKVKRIIKTLPKISVALTSRARETIESFEVELDRQDDLKAMLSIRELSDSQRNPLPEKLKEHFIIPSL